MEKPSIKTVISKGILLVVLTMAFVIFSIRPVPWKFIAIATVIFSLFVAIISVITYKYSLWFFNHKKIIIIIAVIAFVLGNVLILLADVVELRENSIYKNYDTDLSDETKFVMINNSNFTNNPIYQDSNCVKFFPIFKGNYSDSINYINELFLDIGLKNRNTFKVDMIKNGYGILFYTVVPDNQSFMNYCSDISKNFPRNDSIDCRTPRKDNTSILITTSFRVVNDVLEARYFVPC